MDRKTFLRNATIAISFIGFVFVISPFFWSLKPSPHLSEYPLRVEIAGMMQNSIKIIRLKESRIVEIYNGTRWESGDALLVIKGAKGEFYLYWFPTWEKKYPMPRKIWGQHEGYCQQIGIEVEPLSIKVVCKKTTEAVFLYKEWLWSIEGANLGKVLPDLIRVKHRIVNGALYARWPIK